MVLRIALFVIMSLGLVGFGTVAWVTVHPQSQHAGEAGAAVAEISVLVASHPLRAGSLLKADDFTTAKQPAANVTENALLEANVKAADLNGTLLRRTLRQGDAVLASDILRPMDRGFLSAVLSPGMRAISVAVDVVTGTAGLIWPGDHVDVLLTQSLDDASRPVGQRVASHTVLGDIRVLAIDQKLVEGTAPDAMNAKPASTVTLEVSPEQAERVAVAARIGRLSLVVRSAEAGATTDNLNHVTWGGDVSPALGNQAPVASSGNTVIRVYRGSNDAKEFRF